MLLGLRPGVQRLCEASDLNPDDPDPYLLMGKMQAVETTPVRSGGGKTGRFYQASTGERPGKLLLRGQSLEAAEVSGGRCRFAQVKSLLEKAVQLDPKLGSRLFATWCSLFGAKRFLQRNFRLSTSDRGYSAAGGGALSSGGRLPAGRRNCESASRLQLYEQISKEKEEDLERQRHELQQFVYQLRDQTPASQPQ